MSLITTVVGSFPKPSYVPIKDWFDASKKKKGMNTSEVTRLYTDYKKNKITATKNCLLKQQQKLLICK